MLGVWLEQRWKVFLGWPAHMAAGRSKHLYWTDRLVLTWWLITGVVHFLVEGKLFLSLLLHKLRFTTLSSEIRDSFRLQYGGAQVFARKPWQWLSRCYTIIDPWAIFDLEALPCLQDMLLYVLVTTLTPMATLSARCVSSSKAIWNSHHFCILACSKQYPDFLKKQIVCNMPHNLISRYDRCQIYRKQHLLSSITALRAWQDRIWLDICHLLCLA